MRPITMNSAIPRSRGAGADAGDDAVRGDPRVLWMIRERFMARIAGANRGPIQVLARPPWGSVQVPQDTLSVALGKSSRRENEAVPETASAGVGMDAAL